MLEPLARFRDEASVAKYPPIKAGDQVGLIAITSTTSRSHPVQELAGAVGSSTANPGTKYASWWHRRRCHKLMSFTYQDYHLSDLTNGCGSHTTLAGDGMG